MMPLVKNSRHMPRKNGDTYPPHHVGAVLEPDRELVLRGKSVLNASYHDGYLTS